MFGTMNRNQPAPNYTVIALDGLFQCKQKTHLDDLQPKWLAATVSRTRGCSFGPTRKGQQLTPHQRRLQDMRRTKTKKRSRFAWKKDSSAHVSPTPGSPFSSPNNSPTHSTRHIPFNSNSEKTCWFDQFSKPPEDEDPSLYHDKVHFHLRQLAKKARSNVLDRDRRSWQHAAPYIDASVQRNLHPQRNVHFVTDMTMTSTEKKVLFMKSRPADSGKTDMSSTTANKKGDLEMAMMRSNTRRMVYREPLQSGLPPPQQDPNWKRAMIVRHPQSLSTAFLSTAREQQVHSRNHKVQLQGGARQRGSVY